MALRSAPIGSIQTALGNLDIALDFFEQYNQLESINKFILQCIQSTKNEIHQCDQNDGCNDHNH